MIQYRNELIGGMQGHRDLSLAGVAVRFDDSEWSDSGRLDQPRRDFRSVAEVAAGSGSC